MIGQGQFRYISILTHSNLEVVPFPLQTEASVHTPRQAEQNDEY